METTLAVFIFAGLVTRSLPLATGAAGLAVFAAYTLYGDARGAK